MKKKTIYLLSPDLSWKTFKMLYDKLVKDSGPKPEHGDKMLWKMLRKKMIYCWFDFEDLKNNMAVGIVLPKNVIIKMVTNPKK